MRSLDITIATALLLAGLSTTFFAYNEIRKVESPTVTFLNDHLHKGKNSYTVLSHERCVGEVKFNLDDSESITIQGNAVLRVSAENLMADAMLSYHAIFNPLMQFAGGEAKLRFGEIEIRVGAEGTNPIVLTLSSKGLNTERKFEYPLRGPMILTQLSKDSYAIDYRYALQFSPVLSHPGLSQLKQTLSLTLEREDNLVELCKEKGVGRLDLAPAVEAARSLSFFAGALP